MVAVAEAICTGSLAGHNAVRYLANMKYLQLPSDLLIGDFLNYSNEEFHKEGGTKKRFTFAGSIYFNRMKELDFYTIDKEIIEKRVKDADLLGVYDKKLI